MPGSWYTNCMHKTTRNEFLIALSIYLAATLILIGTQTLISLVDPPFFNGNTGQTTGLALLNLGWYILTAIGFYFLYRSVIHEELKPLKEAGVRGSLSFILQGVIVMYLVQITVGVILSFTGLFEVSENQDVLVEFLNFSPLTQIAVALFGIVLAPITEELLFRRSLFNFLKTKGPVAAAVLLTSGLFGLVHAVSELSNIVVMIPYIAIGIVLQLYYIKTQSVGVTMAMHAIYNGISIATLILASYLDVAL